MAWNFLQIVELGAESDELYPVPTGRDLGFELSAQDSNPATLGIAGVKVARQSGQGPWIPSLNVLRVHGKLLISDLRIAVTFHKFVPKDQSSFDPVQALRPDGSAPRRPKQALVGHLLMTQMRQIGVRAAATGKSKSFIGKPEMGLGSLIVSATDETGGSSPNGGQDGFGDHVTIEIMLAAGIDPVEIGNVVLSRSALARVSSPLFSIDQTVRQQWADLIHQGFSPTPGEIENHPLSPYQVVRIVRPGAVPSSLTPPTDTSPVPVMRPTPAFAMPSLAGPPAQAPPPAPTNSAEFVGPPKQPAPPIEPSPAALFAPPAVAGPAPTDDVVVVSLPEPLVPPPPPPGTTADWRPDPFGRFEVRYWDGFGWTEHVHSNGEQSTDPPR